MICVVTGASRGAGRAIAIELGAAGATVYVTGRSSRAQPALAYGAFLAQAQLAQMPGTIDDTAEQVTAAGGRGIAVRCDHGDVEQVRALFERVEREQGRIDVLVNNAWGGHESFTMASLSSPFWEQPLDHWQSMFEHGVKNHVIACHVSAPLFVKQQRGAIFFTTYADRNRYLKGNLFYDLAKAAITRLAFGVGEELRPHGIASVALSPGWMRTEIILNAFKTDEEHWREVPPLARTESPRYLGRAVVALASDPKLLEKTGGVYQVGDLAKEYGFTDIDGRVIPPFELD